MANDLESGFFSAAVRGALRCALALTPAAQQLPPR